jgi:hypothetical protein
MIQHLTYPKLLLIMLLMLPSFCFAQEVYEGQAVDQKTELPILNVTIRSAKQRIATSANDQGYFKLTLPNAAINDTLIFTSIGYETFRLPLKNYLKQMFIKMQQSNTLLNKVTINNEQIKYVTLDKFTIGDIREGRINQNTFNATIPIFTHDAFAKLFVAPKDNAHLQRIQLGRRDYVGYQTNNVYTTTNKFARFLLHIMSADPKTGSPDKILFTKEVTLQDNSLMVSVDVSEEKFVIPSAQFFVAVEWLQIPFNEVINLNPIKRVEKINKKGKEVIGDLAKYSILYQPFLVAYQHPSKVVTWFRNGGNWGNFYVSDKYTIALSATIFY